MSQRRFHTKSRHGCLQCKKNRTKCDEVLPRCGRCKRTGFDCSFLNQTSNWTLIPAEREETRKAEANGESVEIKFSPPSFFHKQDLYSPEGLKSYTVSTPSTEQLVVESHFSDIERERLRLMNHYTLHTWKSIAEITIPEGRDELMWGAWVTELSFENEFLLHALLSLSALHLALRDISRQKYTIMAIHHHGLGVALFRPLLTTTIADNFDAAFAFAVMISLYSFGIQRVSRSEVDPIAKFREVLILIRRSAAINKSAHGAMERSPWSALLITWPIQSKQKFSDKIEHMFSTLLQRTLTSTSVAAQKDMYVSAIQTLRESFTVAITNRSSSMTLTWFPIMCPNNFWAMVRVSDPLALAILANYAVILYWIRDNIWMEGWGKETIDAVRQAIPSEWHDCIAWAIQETELA